MALDQITSKLVDEFLNDTGMRKDSPERDFERFAAHVLISPHIDGAIAYEHVMTGSGRDTGIDAIAVAINGELVTDPDQLDEWSRDGTTLDVHFFFIQAKTSPSFSSSTIGHIGYGVKDFFLDNPTLERNKEVQSAAELANKVFDNARLFRNRNPTCSVCYVTVGKWMDDPDLVARSTAAEHDIDSHNLFSDVRFIPVDARAIQRRYHHLRMGAEREFTFQNRVSLPDIEGVAESHLGFIPATELLRVIEDDGGDLAPTVFYENVRDYQGDQNVVNQGIRATLSGERKSLFPLMNNGVTVIAKTMRQTGTKFLIQDFQVVNGCQTCNVLWAGRETLDDSVLVPLRLISTENEDVMLDIIRATNRQTEVKEEQFYATSEYLKQLERFFESSPDSQRLYLERRLRQYANSSVERTRIVPFNSLIRSFASVVLNEPHRATRNYRQLLDRIPEDILHDDHMPSVYFAAASSLYRLEFMFRNGIIDRRFSSAKFHLLLASRLLIDPDVPGSLNSRKADKWGDKLTKVYWDQSESEALFIEASEDIENLADSDLSRDRIRTHQFTEQVLDFYRKYPR